MQVNQPQGGTTKATTASLAVGDKVSYVAVTGEGHGYRFSARNGVILEIDGNVATLRASNGRSITHPLNKLTPDGQPDALTRMLMVGQ